MKLGVNIDHVATIRNARGIETPDPVRYALMAVDAGADIITFHLREDRRHINDQDVFNLKNNLKVPLNFECAATDEMLGIIQKIKPEFACLVPENRHEITTEGGLDVVARASYLKDYIKELKKVVKEVSLFIEPSFAQIEAAKEVGADIIEIHTGKYANSYPNAAYQDELANIKAAINHAQNYQLIVNAGHGLNIDNLKEIVALGNFRELHIGHFLVGESLFKGVNSVIKEIKDIIS
jgi:pyridoxine 5-phosphate synthase